MRQLGVFHHIALIAVHHTTKAKQDTIFDSMIGTTGISGPVDVGLQMFEENKTKYIRGSGKDYTEDIEHRLVFDAGWKIVMNVSPEQQRVLSLLKNGELHYKDIAKLLDKTENAMLKLLNRMIAEDLIVKVGNGIYSLPT